MSAVPTIEAEQQESDPAPQASVSSRSMLMGRVRDRTSTTRPIAGRPPKVRLETHRANRPAQPADRKTRPGHQPPNDSFMPRQASLMREASEDAPRYRHGRPAGVWCVGSVRSSFARNGGVSGVTPRRLLWTSCRSLLPASRVPHSTRKRNFGRRLQVLRTEGGLCEDR